MNQPEVVDPRALQRKDLLRDGWKTAFSETFDELRSLRTSFCAFVVVASLKIFSNNLHLEEVCSAFCWALFLPWSFQQVRLQRCRISFFLSPSMVTQPRPFTTRR